MNATQQDIQQAIDLLKQLMDLNAKTNVLGKTLLARVKQAYVGMTAKAAFLEMTKED